MHRQTGDAKVFFLPCIFGLLLSGTMFLSADCFTDSEVLPKCYVFLLCVAIWLGASAWTAKSGLVVQVDAVAIAFSFFMSYLIVRALCSPSGPGIWYMVAGLCFYFLCRAIGTDTWFINRIIVCLCVLQALYGLLQYAGFPSDPAHPITGSFDNPAGFAACVSAGYPFGLMPEGKSRLWRRIALAGSVVMVVSVILSESRAGIVAILAVTILFAVARYAGAIRKHKKYILPISGLLLAGLILMLVYLKRDSASGRLLIWRVTTDLIRDNHPLTGGGIGSFRADYMLHQAGYFADRPDSPYASLAGNVKHPFNEFLLLTAESGLIGIFLLSLVVWMVAKQSRNTLRTGMLSICTIAVFACFSYPLRYPFIWVILIYCLSRLPRGVPIREIRITRSVYTKIPLIGISALILCATIRDVKFEYAWKKLSVSSLAGNSESAFPDYLKLYSHRNRNPLFLYNFGAELNHAKKYRASLQIMHECERRFNDYDVQMILARNYSGLSDWPAAERYYRLASRMCPSRFLPLQGLLNIYKNTGNEEQATQTASAILQKEVKVPSLTVLRIVCEARTFLYP